MNTKRLLSLAILVIALAADLLAANAPKKAGVKLATGKDISRADAIAMVDAVTADDKKYLFVNLRAPVLTTSAAYAEVNAKWLTAYMRVFKAVLSDAGVPTNLAENSRGDFRFNCTAFTDKFLGDAGLVFYAEAFHSWSKAARPALGAVYYIPDYSLPDANGFRISHAIVFALTDEGVKFLDPMRGIIELSDSEKKTIFHRRL